MYWVTVGIFVALQVGEILGGEISQFDYKEDGYNGDLGRCKQVVLKTLSANHKFTLDLHKYTRRSLTSGDKHRNVFEVYYDSYLIERMKATDKYDSMHGQEIGDSLKNSVKPVSVSGDLAQPFKIIVRYSKVGSTCVERTYTYDSKAKKYKKLSEEVVEKQKDCQ